MTYRTSMKDIMLKKFFNAILALFATSTVAAQSEPLKILFIGNSYTHMNDMPKMFEKISKDAGLNVIVEKSALSGASFHVHSERKDMFKAINKRQWDYVVLQGYSRELIFEPEHLDTASIPYINQITDSIYKNNPCTNLLFYMTWGYDGGYLDQENVNTYDKMADKIESGYRYLSETYDVPVVPVGMAWKKVRATEEMDLYAEDRAHPSKEGSFLIASTFFESIFGIQANEDIGIIKERYARRIRQAVNEVLIENRMLYKLDRNQINLETVIVDTLDDEQMMVEYAINYPEAKSVLWTFDKDVTSTNFTGFHKYSKHGKHNVQVDIITGCGDKRTYNREILFIDPERLRRRNERSKLKD